MNQETTTPTSFTLQLLHAADQEGGISALEDAPNFSAVLNALKTQDADADGTPDFPNTLVLSSGDVYSPGAFFFASETVYGGVARGDILIQNELGFQAIALGNHEFDRGTGVLADVLQSSTSYAGAQFPYLSTNLDASTDATLADLVAENGQEASDVAGKIAGNTIITVNGEKLGIVGATTPALSAISAPGDVTVTPLAFDSSDPDDIAALAAEIQASVDALLADNSDLNKVILLAHMQQIAIEEQLAELLTGVDIIVAGGSNTLLADESDRLRLGDTADGVYPILKTAADGNPVAVVNTEGNYRYVGRLVAEFDADGVIIPASIDPEISGAYATDSQGVAAVRGTRDPEVVQITEALREVIAEQDGNLFGRTSVFLNGIQADVRSQETNLGNLTADANLAIAKQRDPETVISIKHGGGITDNIGVFTFPPGSTEAEDGVKLPPQANVEAGKAQGDISQLDITNALKANDGLTLLTLTATELLEVIEHGLAAEGEAAAQFLQVSGLTVSYSEALPAGNRVQSLGVRDGEGNLLDTVVRNGDLVGNPDRTFRVVTLSSLADGGNGYPFPTRDRRDLVIEDAANPDPTLRTGEAIFAPDGSEQDALAEYLVLNFNETPFNGEDDLPEADTRIQNISLREDTALQPGVGGTDGTGSGNPNLPKTLRIFEIQGQAHRSPVAGQLVSTTGVVTAVDFNGFYIQDLEGDGTDATSDAIFVFTNEVPTVLLGDLVSVAGTVSEFTPQGGASKNLSVTQLGGELTISVQSANTSLPFPIILGSGGRVPPTEIISDDASRVNRVLEEAQEVPPIADTPATGTFNVTLNGDLLEVSGSFSELSAPLLPVGEADSEGNPQSAVHLHLGEVGENGPIIRNLTVTPDAAGTGGTFSGRFTLTPEETAAVQAKGTYLNIHTDNNASGELRGQVNLSSDVYDSQIFDPVEDGIDFYESLEGMRVTVQDAIAVSPSNEFGEIVVVANQGAQVTGLSDRGTINISPDDFNPERIQIQLDRTVLPGFSATAKVGDRLGDVTGVLSYNFGNFELLPTEAFTVTPGTLTPEVTELTGSETQLTIASYNVLNLDPKVEDVALVTGRDPDEVDDDLGDGRFEAIATQIVNNLGSPDIVALQEIQDGDGAELSELVDGEETYTALIAAIEAAGGPTYAFAEIPPEPGTTGGQPGGNIRVGYLYNPERVSLQANSLKQLTDPDLTDGDAFEDSRTPLVATFEFAGEDVTVINNHFASKSGGTALFGRIQPPIDGGKAQRIAQAQIVNDYVDSLLATSATANVVVLGDFNDFEFSELLDTLKGGETPVLTNLTDTLPENERYTYIFEGNSQSLDHLLVSDALATGAEYDVVHVNTEFSEQASDHDPILARLDLTGSTPAPEPDDLTTGGSTAAPDVPERTVSLEPLGTAFGSTVVQQPSLLQSSAIALGIDPSPLSLI